MASNKRKCEQCGGFSSPHIPRERVGDKLLCQGCAARAKAHTAAKKVPGKKPGAYLKPKDEGQFDFWEGELGPENVHPLQAALPNSVWEKYNKHRELLGKPPFSTDHLNEAAQGGDSEPYSEGAEPPQAPKKDKQTRLRLWRRKRSSLGKMAEAGHPEWQKPMPHTHNMSAGELAQHINEHHPGITGATPETDLQTLNLFHHNSHQDDAHFDDLEHFHHNPEVPDPVGAEALKQHLHQHHPIADWEVDLMGGDHDALKDTHDQFHESTAYTGADAPKHTHPEGVAEKETVGGSGEHDHNVMTPEEMEAHLQDKHGLKPAGVGFVQSDHGSGVGSPTHNMEKWHTEHHDGLVAGGEPHDHGGPVTVSAPDGPEQLKHPSKYTNSSLHGHLLTDHGINPDHLENAINGTFEATDPSHVVHMLHNQMHAEGQAKFAHTHENWQGGPEIHEGHTDVGKPFWGTPPKHVQKSMDHLLAKKSEGGHGLTGEGLGSIMTDLGLAGKLSEDEEFHKAYEQIHGNLHQEGGDDVTHQHVPTIQPGVMSPEKIKKEKLKQHLKDYHGDKTPLDQMKNPEQKHNELHDPESFLYQHHSGHPGHEHVPWDKHGPVTQELPTPSHLEAEQTGKSYAKGHHEHATNMSHNQLVDHIKMSHKTWKGGQAATGGDFTDAFLDFSDQGKSHEQLLKEHAVYHATGDTNGHTHEPVGNTGPLEEISPYHGGEPEIQTDTHPAITSDHEALAHILQHHPNVDQEDYQDWGEHHPTGKTPSMVSFHDALHSGEKTSLGNTLPKVLDGHDHADPVGPPTEISVGSHLVHEHGMAQEDVAAMTPQGFKAHHERLHRQKSELDIGHGHDYPGGPQRDPRTILPNTHHQAMRDDDRHEAVQEWYHGTGTDYDGPPKSATELQNDHGFWGNFGGGDWNNHVGTHWSSLHEMSKNFNGSGNRVIHAKLHMSNPIVYNSLNHMSHDAYERLRASGHLQDDGHFEDNHGDDNGYNECCSGRLLEYAKGHHRSDGKFGLEAYRDSLRASGHDGIHVRNQADSPSGHWNAIPLSADQIEITQGGCRGYHNDERDHDVREFRDNETKLTRGWVHPKDYSPDDYVGTKLDHLPTADDVQKAHEAKHEAPQSNKTAIGRGDSDKYGGPYGSADSSGDDEDDDHYCSHCDDDTDHESKDCKVSKWCHVCDKHGDHEAGDGEHDYCDHCEDYADHDTDGCAENPENWKKESYCPHCDTTDKNNQHSSECVNCGKKLPDWGKLQTFGKPISANTAPGKGYNKTGETDEANYGPAHEATYQPKTDHELATHLYHHHKSDVGGKAFDTNGNWDEESLKAHHQWLHMNPDHAKEKGFAEVDHNHLATYGDFPSKMTPHETKAHMMLGHVGEAGGVSNWQVHQIMHMTPEQAVQAHKMAHDADDAVQWGQKNDDHDLIPKITHTHNLGGGGTQTAMDDEHAPHGDDLVAHLSDPTYHIKNVGKDLAKHLSQNPETAEALHKQLHENFGPSAPGGSHTHLHTPEMLTKYQQQAAVKKHLVEDHGAPPDHFAITGKDLAQLMKVHHEEHTTNYQDYQELDHKHFGGTAHQDPSGHTAENMKKMPTKAEQIKQHMKDHHGATGKMAGLDLQKLMSAHSAEHGPHHILDKPEHKHEGLGTIQHANDYMVHTNQTMKSNEKAPELKSTPAHELVAGNAGYDLDSHISFHHKDDVEPHLKHQEGFDYAPGTPVFQKALEEAHEAHMKAHAEGGDHDHGGTAKMGSPDVQKQNIKLESPAQKKWGEGSIIHHIMEEEHQDHPGLMKHVDNVLDAAGDNGPNHPSTNSAYLEMAKAHKAYHQEHGHPTHTHYDNEPHPKEAGLRTLTNLFEEVAL